MRVSVGLLCLVGLAGCLPASPEVQQLQMACQTGNLQACYAAESLQQQQSADFAARLDAINNRTYGSGSPTTTTCRQSGSQVICTSY